MDDFIIPFKFYYGELEELRKNDIGAWRSLVAQHADTVEVGGSNPPVPTVFD